jgi:hypothetical protein
MPTSIPLLSFHSRQSYVYQMSRRIFPLPADGLRLVYQSEQESSEDTYQACPSVFEVETQRDEVGTLLPAPRRP